MRFHLFSRLDADLPPNVVRMLELHPPQSAEGAPHVPGLGTATGRYLAAEGRWVPQWRNSLPDYTSARVSHDAAVVADQAASYGHELARGRPRPLLLIRGWGQEYARTGSPPRVASPAIHWHHDDRVSDWGYGRASLYVRAGVGYWADWGRTVLPAVQRHLEGGQLSPLAGVVLDMETAPSHRNSLRMLGGQQVGSWPAHQTDTRWWSYRGFPARDGRTWRLCALAELAIPGHDPAQEWHHAANLGLSRWWAGMVRSATSAIMDRALWRLVRRLWPGCSTMQYDSTQSDAEGRRLWETTGEATIGGWQQRYCAESHQGVVLYNFPLSSKAGGESDAAYMLRATDEQLEACNRRRPLLPWLCAVGQVQGGTGPDAWNMTAEVLGAQIERLGARGVTDAILWWDPAMPGADMPATLDIAAGAAVV